MKFTRLFAVIVGAVLVAPVLVFKINPDDALPKQDPAALDGTEHNARSTDVTTPYETYRQFHRQAGYDAQTFAEELRGYHITVEATERIIKNHQECMYATFDAEMQVHEALNLHHAHETCANFGSVGDTQYAHNDFANDGQQCAQGPNEPFADLKYQRLHAKHKQVMRDTQEAVLKQKEKCSFMAAFVQDEVANKKAADQKAKLTEPKKSTRTGKATAPHSATSTNMATGATKPTGSKAAWWPAGAGLG